MNLFTRLQAATVLAIGAVGPGAPAFAEDWHGLLLDREVGFAVADGFGAEPSFSDAAPGHAIIEFQLPGETETAWTQMLTLTALADGAGLPADQAVTNMAGNLAQGYANACPDSFAAEDLGAPALPGAEAVLAGWLGCGEVSGTGISEAMVVLVIGVGGTVYTVQWAEHVPASPTPPVYDAARWLPRLDALTGFSL